MEYRQNSVSKETKEYKITYNTHKQSIIPANDLVILHSAKEAYADEALKILISEVKHRQIIESKQSNNQRISIIFAFLLTIGMLGSTIFLAISGHNSVAIIMASTTIIGVIGAFIKKS
jgi:hypothetical protein